MNCVFCDIANNDPKKQILKRIITPIDNIEVIIIEPYNPVTKGHLLFIPVKHHVNMFNNSMISAAVAYAVSEYSSDSNTEFNLIVNNGIAAGQTVFHMHFHYLPRYENDSVKLPWDH